MKYPPEFYLAVAALFKLLTPIAKIALHLIQYNLPLH